MKEALSMESKDFESLVPFASDVTLTKSFNIINQTYIEYGKGTWL